ncbi:MAG: hypothetical protein ACRCVT_07715 [Leadbetterella sp.]
MKKYQEFFAHLKHPKLQNYQTGYYYRQGKLIASEHKGIGVVCNANGDILSPLQIQKLDLLSALYESHTNEESYKQAYDKYHQGYATAYQTYKDYVLDLAGWGDASERKKEGLWEFCKEYAIESSLEDTDYIVTFFAAMKELEDSE